MERAIDDRLPVDTGTDPIQVKEDDFGRLEELRRVVEDLNTMRQEMGRLFQILGNLKLRADSLEGELSEKRKAMCSLYGISEGGWAIDFATKSFVRLDGKAPLVP